MKVGFDIGGVLSKDERFRELLRLLEYAGAEIFIITDMHRKEDIFTLLDNNNIPYVRENVYAADYNKYGDMCKAILLKELQIDIMIDDHLPYLEWDSELGPAPVRLFSMPNPWKPYWSEDWRCDGGEFGRRVSPENLLEGDEHARG